MKRSRRTITAAVMVAVKTALLLSGCTAHNEMCGVVIPNIQPDTRITAHPPEQGEVGFRVSFEWCDSDPDGRIEGFQWKLCAIGDDGIDIPDTLTADPVTGEILHPWHFTTSTDSTFFISFAEGEAHLRQFAA